MRIRVLGPVEVEGDDGALQPLAPKARQLLTLLALHAPRAVGVDELAELMWDDAPPAATKTIQAHVSRLRAALGAAADIDRSGVGYRLRPAPGACDLDVLAAHRAAARRGADRDRAGATAGAVAELAAARALWRGGLELPGTVAALGLAVRWDQERRSLVDEHLAAVVAGDRPGDVVAELHQATAQAPADERRWTLLVRALHRSGDQAGALRAYQSARRALAGVGLEPGAALRDAEAAAVAGPRPLATPTRTAAAARVVRYADTGGGRVAYTVTGDGPVTTVVLLPGLVSIDGIAHLPRLADAVDRLADHGAVACLDRRGIGLSDPVVGDATPGLPSLDHWVDDVVAVLDATGVAPVLFACADTALVALAVAAAHPDRVRGVVGVHAYARYTRGDGYPFGVDPETAAATSGDVLDVDVPEAGDVPDAAVAVARFDPLAYVAPSVAGDPDFRRWFDDVGRRAASPHVAAALHRVVLDADIRDLLPDVRVPVLLLHRRSCASADIGHARYLRDHLPDSRLTVLPGADELWFTGDIAPLLQEIDRWRTDLDPTAR